MNALFIGPYRQNDGWGIASREYIKAIATQIPDLATRPIYYTENKADIDQEISNYEKRNFDSYDIVFQKVLPQSISASAIAKKNVGLSALETNNITNFESITNINRLDEICVPSTVEAKCLRESGITTKIKSISQPIDIDLYKTKHDHKINLPFFTDNTFYFYTIGEWIERKNFKDLIAAFHLAFDIVDDVGLVIKTSEIHGDSQKIQSDIQKITNKLRIRREYKKEIIITQKLTDDDMIGLHNACHCFVMPSFGEAFCRPAAEALICGNTPIVTDKIGTCDFIDNNNGYLINSRKQPIITSEPCLSENFNMYNANEYWLQPSVTHLIECMQKIYRLYKNNRKEYEAKRIIGIESAEQFSYTNIGKKICG